MKLSWYHHMVSGRRSGKGFTLIELLVVIAIIALLMSIIVPTLKRAKEAAKRAVCLQNLKSLTIGWILYVDDNHGEFPKAYVNADDTMYGLKNIGWIHNLPGDESLKQGVIYPYVGTTKVYRCPVAKKEELRTYSIPHSMHGYAGTGYGGGKIATKINDIKTIPANRMLFLDDYYSNSDGCFMIWLSREAWWNTCPIRHGSGGNTFSFLDGHADFWNWKDQRTIDLVEREGIHWESPDCIQPGNPDIARMQKAIWGETTPR